MTQILILLDGTTDGDHKQQHPRNANFGKHLEVDALPILASKRPESRSEQSRIQRRAHKDVVRHVAAHSDRFTTIVEPDSKDVDENGRDERDQDRDGHELSKVFDQPRQSEETRDVQTERECEGGVP